MALLYVVDKQVFGHSDSLEQTVLEFHCVWGGGCGGGHPGELDGWFLVQGVGPLQAGAWSGRGGQAGGAERGQDEGGGGRHGNRGKGRGEEEGGGLKIGECKTGRWLERPPVIKQ